MNIITSAQATNMNMLRRLVMFRLMLLTIPCFTFYLTKFIYDDNNAMAEQEKTDLRYPMDPPKFALKSTNGRATTYVGKNNNTETTQTPSTTTTTEKVKEIFVVPQDTMMSKSGEPMDLHMYQSKPLYIAKPPKIQRKLYYPINIEPPLKPVTKPAVCRKNTTSPKLIVLVISAARNIQQRHLIRLNWGNQAKFSIINEYDVKVLFVVAVDTNSTRITQQKLRAEATGQEDLIQVQMSESYDTLVEKELSAFQWIYEKCFKHDTIHKRDFIAKTDDDMYINMFAAVEMLTLHRSHNLRRAVFGDIFLGAFPERQSTNTKWPLSVAEYPYSNFPFFARGGFYMISAEIVHEMLERAPKEHFVPYEDVFLTGLVMQTLDVTFFSFSRFGILIGGTDSALITAANKVFVHTDDKMVKMKLWTHALRRFQRGVTQFYSVVYD